MKLYLGLLTTEEPLFFASKELSHMYVTAPYVGNYALTYALHFAPEEYQGLQKTRYKEDFQSLDAYVFPAKFLDYRWTTQSFNSTGEGFYLRMGNNIVIDSMMYIRIAQEHRKHLEKEGRWPTFNSPQIGLFKMISPEGKALFFVLSSKTLRFPKFIRLGKFLTKCRLEISELQFQEGTGSFLCTFPLNPLDLARAYVIRSYRVVSIKPVPIIESLQAEGNHLRFEVQIGDAPSQLCLPSLVGYFRFKES